MDEGGTAGATVDRWSPGGLDRLKELYGPLRRFAAVVGRIDVDPDDLVQEAFTRVLARPEGAIGDLGPYLRRAIVNAATDERRRARRRDDLVARVGFADVTNDVYPSELADLLRLTPRSRALLYLVEVEGWLVAEAARATGMTHVAARAALVRARRTLRAELEADDG
ncbi:MAG: hypothetical protein KatS3mg009_2908 [Acidimicrobiia bacterium]|nr:MAG: hypothetical protein KatS3mg009_2908 [Acidimicrobiia bacterium]